MPSGRDPRRSPDGASMSQPPKLTIAGHMPRWRRVNGLALGEVELAPHERVHRDSHACHRFVLVLKGELVEIRDGETERWTASSVLFRQAGEARTYQAGANGAVCLVVALEPAWLRRARGQSGVLARSAAFRGGLAVHLAQRLHGEFRLRDEVSRLAIESLVLGLLAETSRRAAREAAGLAIPLWLVRARAIMDARFADRLALTTVAALVGVHPVHLARSFRRTYRTTFGAYLRGVRLDFAQRELARSTQPLSAIAAAAGFCDQSHLSRLFKRQTGMSPSAYRAACARGR